MEKAVPLLQSARRAFACSRTAISTQTWAQFLLLSGILELYSSDVKSARSLIPLPFEQLTSLYPEYTLAKGYPDQVKAAFANARSAQKKRSRVNVQVNGLDALALTTRLNGQPVSSGSVGLLPGVQLLQLIDSRGAIIAGAVTDLKAGDTPTWPHDLFPVPRSSELQARLHTLAMGTVAATGPAASDTLIAPTVKTGTGDGAQVDDSPLIAALLHQLQEYNAPWLLVVSAVKGHDVRSAFLLFPDGRFHHLQWDAQLTVEHPRKESSPDSALSLVELSLLAGVTTNIEFNAVTSSILSLGVGRPLGPFVAELLADVRQQSIPEDFQTDGPLAGARVYFTPTGSLFLARPIALNSLRFTPRVGVALGSTLAMEVQCETVENSEDTLITCGDDKVGGPALLSRLVLGPSAALSLSYRLGPFPLEPSLQLRAQYSILSFEGASDVLFDAAHYNPLLLDVQVGVRWRR